MSKYIHKSHNVSVLLYHLVYPAKYRKMIFSEKIEKHLRDICLEISQRFEIEFIEIGVDGDHVHFLIQSIPTFSPTKIVRTVKSITAREIFKRAPEVKKELWGGEFWTKGYFINSVSQHGNESVIQNYVQNQGGSEGALPYQKIHEQQLSFLKFQD